MSDLFDDILPVGDPTRAMIVVMSLTDEDRVALTQLGVLLRNDQPHDVLLELLRRAAPSNGVHGYPVACFGCGKKYTVKRRPVPGRHSWCDTCKASGEPAADRSRRYRERKHEEVQP